MKIRTYAISRVKRILLALVVILWGILMLFIILNQQKIYVQMVVCCLQEMTDALEADDSEQFEESIYHLQTVNSVYKRESGKAVVDALCVVFEQCIYEDLLDADKEALVIVMREYTQDISNDLIIKKETQNISGRIEVILDNYLEK